MMKNIRFYTIAVLFGKLPTPKVNRSHMDIRYSTLDIGSHVISCLSSVNVTRTFTEKPCMCDSPRLVTLIHPRIQTGTTLLNREENITCAIMRHDNTTPPATTVANTKNFGQRRGNYISLLRILSSSKNYKSSRHLPMNRWSRWLK